MNDMILILKLVGLVLFITIAAIYIVREIRSAMILDLDNEWEELVSLMAVEDRSDKELLQIMFENTDQIFKDHPHNCDGLCLVVEHLKNVTYSERIQLYLYLKNNLPKAVDDNVAHGYSWDPGEVVPRLRWLQTQIDKL